LRAGDRMLIADHLNLTWRNPLIGPLVAGETRFPDMSAPYDPDLRRIAVETALERGVPLEAGVYAAVLGPSYETPAEIRMLRALGADAVGMSTVPEVVAARALGLRCLGVSCITNLAAGLGAGKLSHDEVLAAGEIGGHRLAGLLRAVLPRVAPSNLPSEAAS
ncbi:MAG TPA: purine-nucleoside phosphorylase, partial [Longimicrobiaceae bacterium]|nr:purine-nucleoside phosphorylase [Longimicrobiaceae bacterium]